MEVKKGLLSDCSRYVMLEMIVVSGDVKHRTGGQEAVEGGSTVENVQSWLEYTMLRTLLSLVENSQ